jgi:hypothetical protein
MDENKIVAIHVCRSGHWTPPWCDPDFIKFIAGMSEEASRDPSLLRPWKALPAEEMQKLIDMNQELRSQLASKDEEENK